jgi:hypothetical protein
MQFDGSYYSNRLIVLLSSSFFGYLSSIAETNRLWVTIVFSVVMLCLYCFICYCTVIGYLAYWYCIII